MAPAEIRAIRGSLSRAAFARLLSVTPLTVLRWELPEDSKEARRPRPRMIEALRRLAADGVGVDLRPPAEHDDDELDPDASEPVRAAAAAEPAAHTDYEATVHPLLDLLGTELWARAENQLLAVLSSGTLRTDAARQLARLGIVQAQIFGTLDLGGALTTLLPILDEAERGDLPRAVAARAHVLATRLFSSPDPRFFDPGRVNAHVARAQALLDPGDPGADDLRVYLATAAIAGSRFLGPHVLLRTYEAHAPALARASGPLATVLAEAIHHFVALGRGDRAGAERHRQAYAALLERLRMPYLDLAILEALTRRALGEAATPDEILALAQKMRAQANDARLAPTDELFRSYGYEIEAHIRRGHFGDAEAAYRAALATARRDGMPLYSLVPAACHMFALLDRRADLEALARDLEAEGPPRAGPNHHALHARAAALLLAEDPERGAELFERICSAPDAAPGIDDLRHQACYGLVVVRLAQGDPDRSRAAIRRFQALLEERPSLWYSAVLRRLDGFALYLEGRSAEARQKLEAVRPAFRVLGDVTELAMADLDLAIVARASGAAGGEQRFTDAVAALEALGIPNAQRIQRVVAPRAQPAPWSEQTMCERLVIALDRLSVRGLRAHQWRGELASIVKDLFPGHAVAMAPARPADGGVPDGSGGLLLVTVAGELSAEERAALRLFEALVPADAVVLPPPEPERASDSRLPYFIAIAPVSRRLRREIAQLSGSQATILITGESGSGKEVVARGVHDLSARAERPFVAFNCASVPHDLFEGQLFGYKKGAFTGATTDYPGVIRGAAGGTLFLDEIAELPLETQPKLLRFLENGEIFVIGEQRPRRVEVRVLAATNRDLGRLAREGRFREDLYYRLNVVPLSVPPLRERVEDVLPLARMFIARLAPDGRRPELGADAAVALERHTWPGNVRELRNVIERALAYTPVPEVLRAEHLRIGRS